MDPEKPKSESEDRSPDSRLSAEQRVKRLSGHPPRLTERQRIEARKQRRSGRRLPGKKPSAGAKAGSGADPREGSSMGNPLSRGVRATLTEVRRTAGFLRALLFSGLERVGPALRWLVGGLVGLLSVFRSGLSKLRRLASRAAVLTGGLVVTLDRILTPRRALTLSVSAGVLALIASQFLDFRATEVGQSAYAPIQEITRAPRIDLLTPIDSHSVLLLTVAAVSLAGVIGGAVTGRRAWNLLIVSAGAVVVAVTLAVDLPRGLDVAIAEISYSGVAAVLLSGFWLQLSAGLVLAVGGMGLLLLSGQRRPDRARSRRPRLATESSR